MRRLLISEEDFLDAIDYADLLLRRRLYEPHVNWGDDDFLNSDDCLILEAATHALVVAYSRPFTRSRGHNKAKPVLPDRVWTSTFSEQERELHEEILRKRNQEVAHSDAEVWEVALVAGEKFARPRIEGPGRNLSYDKIEQLKTMINNLLEAIWQALEELFEGPEENWQHLIEPPPPDEST